MVRSILGVVVGIVAGCVVISLIQQISVALYPLPEGMDTSDPDAWKEHVATLPPGAFLWVLGSYLAGGVAGGWLTALIARRPHLKPSVILGVIFTLFSLANILVLPHPVWFDIAALVIPLPSAWVGGMLAGKAKKKN